MAENFDLKVYKGKMDKAHEAYLRDLSTLRTGRANSSMLDLIRVDVYGQKMPINQLATISVPESRLITVQVWDWNNVNLIDSEIRKSNIGINPQIDGQMLRLPIPNLTEERREELKKSMKGIAEKSKISIRNIRREGKDELKKLLDKKNISEDENKKFEKEIQTITDSSIAEIEKVLEKKEKEIMSVWISLSMLLLLWMVMDVGA